MPERSPEEIAAAINAHLGGWNDAMGLRFVRASADECVGELAVGPQHLQPYGIVHGGVHTGIIEAACSTGARDRARPPAVPRCGRRDRRQDGRHRGLTRGQFAMNFIGLQAHEDFVYR